MHAVIFANRERGNALYERTPNFPDGAAELIYQYCIKQEPSELVPDHTPAFSYQPLGGSYLLSVIYRMRGGNNQELRGHVICVNFLMDGPEADHFFRLPFPQAMKAVEKTATELLQSRYEVIPLGHCGSFMQMREEDAPPCRGETPLAVLMMGASYCMERTVTRQVYLQSGRPAIDELNNLLRVLPPPLRKRLSFHTGCVSAGECWGPGICYCLENHLGTIVASDFANGPATTKYWYFADGSGRDGRIDTRNRTMLNRLIQIPERIPLYELLRNAVTDWDTYRELSLLLESDRPKLEEVLDQLPEEAVLDVIYSSEASDLQLAQIAKAARKDSALRRAAKSLRGKAEGSERRISLGDMLRRAKALLHQYREWILLLVCILVCAWCYPAIADCVGADLIRVGLFLAGTVGIGFFLRGIAAKDGKSRDDKKA